ncbi:TonB-dependent receptor domain-containing protein [Vitreimonas flagellata]|uniref:TonB-dependent receptor domain-containing protein n=1 Tax=Vitreimonas flagellata TaxID=2560861 RepID=UPI001074E130|nr:TonB-dependent receptor [Vitreimonas flagellata]
MLGRMMVSALALTGAAYAQTPVSTDAAATADCAPTPACAVTPASSSDRVHYDAPFFAQFNPQTALDMVRQTPGFSLDGGDDRRGFSGAVGNLLIDGLRPSSKSQSLENILSRIPAGQVVRVELLRGGEVAGDASGASVLLNIVRTPTAGSGVWEAGFEYTSYGEPAPRGEFSYSGRSGQIEWGAGVNYRSQYRDLPGWRHFYDGNGVYTGRADTPSPDRVFQEGGINGNIAFPLGGGRFSANAELSGFSFETENGFPFYDAADDPTFELVQVFEEREPGVEVGVNYDRDFGPWSLALIGLVNRENYSSDDTGVYTGSVVGSYMQELDQESGESILRASISRSLSPQHRIEFGAEGAFNSLDQTLVYAENGASINLPNANVLIEEERAELFGTHTWRPADAWTVESRLAWETSTLTFTGDTNDTVELSYWKPSVQVSRRFGQNNQARFRIYRDVGQLDFGDFTSAAAVADGLINGGNPDLVPQTSWIAELGGDIRFGAAALSVTLQHQQISDVADLVPIVAPNPDEDPLDPNDDFFRFDAPGNIGDGELTRLNVNFSTPISFIPGGRITIDGHLTDSEVTDPVTGRSRIISETPESRIDIQFRQDLPDLRFAWGVSIFKQGEHQYYRFNEVDTNEEGPWVDVFVETTALPNDMKLRLWAANITDGTINRERRFFGDNINPDRNGPLNRVDLRERQFAEAPWLILELSGTF